LFDLSKHDYIGGYNFTLSKVISGVDQEHVGNLSGGSKSSGAKAKIMGTELKDDYDSTNCQFKCEWTGTDYSDHVFLVLNKVKTPGKF